MAVTIFGFILYQLSAADVASIQSRRKAVAGRFTGSIVAVGQSFGAIVTAFASNGSINAQVILDGNDSLWVENVVQGTAPGTFQVPS